MMKIKMYLALTGLLLVSLACVLMLAGSTPTPTALPPTDTPSGPTATPGECTITANSTLTMYNRPSTTAQAFSTQAAGFSTQVTAQTADGWFGFDPGVAQAANIGVFRLRWIDSSGDVTLSGDCAGQPVVVPPEPTLCYEMPMGDVTVYTTADAASAVVATLHLEDYAALQGQTSAGDWFLLNLAQGNTGLSGSGWISSMDLNMNGPTCGSIPVTTS